MSPKIRNAYNDKFPYAKRLNELIGDKNNSEISQITGVNTRTIADYMSGRQRPSVDFIAALAENEYDVIYVLTGKICSSSSNLEQKIAEYENLIIRDEDVRLQLSKLVDSNGSIFGSHNIEKVEKLREVQEELKQLKHKIISNKSAKIEEIEYKEIVNAQNTESLEKRVEELEERVTELNNHLKDKEEIISLQRKQLESISDNSDISKIVEDTIKVLEQKRNTKSSNESAG